MVERIVIFSEKGVGMKKCVACGEPSNGVYCLIDFILVMKEVGWDNEMIRKVYWHEREKSSKIE